jgi:hypothetical protein
VRELFFTPEGRADPFPLYHRLREIAPLFRSDKRQASLSTRYDDWKSALGSPIHRNRGYPLVREPSPLVAWHECRSASDANA